MVNTKVIAFRLYRRNIDDVWLLARARLVSAERRSRTIIYRAEIASLRALIDFLATNCCGGRPDLCAALIASTVAAVVCQSSEAAFHCLMSAGVV
jgi:hypothetical protein